MKSFTIFEEYMDLISLLNEREQGEILVAICNYMFYDIVPENLSDKSRKVFRNLKRPLDISKSNSKRSTKKKLIENQNGNRNRNQIKTKTETELSTAKETHSMMSMSMSNVFNNLEELVNYIQQELNYNLHNTPLELNTLKLWIDNKVPKEVIKHSFEEARRRNITNINYIQKAVVNRMEELKKEPKEVTDKLPEWFDKKIEKNTEGLEELEGVLKEFK